MVVLLKHNVVLFYIHFLVLVLGTNATSSVSSRNLQDDSCFVSVETNDELVSFKYRIIEDESNEKFIHAEAVYQGLAWLGVAIASDPPGMPGSQAIVGIPDDSPIPELYDLIARAPNEVIPLADDLQTLFDSSVVQTDTTTTLTFSKYLIETGHNPLLFNETNLFLFAYGFSNAFGFHQNMGGMQVKLEATPNCPYEPLIVETPPIDADGNCWNVANTNDPLVSFQYRLVQDEAGKNILVAEMTYSGEGWVGLGIQGETTGMIGTQAIIGLPDDDSGVPQIYGLEMKDVSGVNPLSADLQTLFDHSIEQMDGTTTLKFSKYLMETGHNPIEFDETNVLLFAYGMSNELGYHLARSWLPVLITSACIVDVAGGVGGEWDEEEGGEWDQEEEGERDEEDDELGEDGICLNKVIVKDGLTFKYRVDEDILTAKLEYKGNAWVAVGIPASSEVAMIGTTAIIGKPSDSSTPQLYDLTSQSEAGIVPLEDKFQTLFDHAVLQTDSFTVLSFSKKLTEEGHNSWTVGEENTLIYATGSTNAWGYHSERGGFPFTLEATCSGATSQAVEVVSDKQKSIRAIWKAHGILAVLAWGVATPIAVLSSVFRDYIHSKGLWFKFHKAFNGISILLTIIAVVLAFYNIDQAGAMHVSKAHHRVGVVVFTFALVQLINGLLRPHVSHDGPVSKKRRGWEIGHRLLGSTILILSIFQILTGLNFYVLYYRVWNWSPVYLALIILFFVLLFGGLYKKRSKSKNDYDEEEA